MAEAAAALALAPADPDALSVMRALAGIATQPMTGLPARFAGKSAPQKSVHGTFVREAPTV